MKRYGTIAVCCLTPLLLAITLLCGTSLGCGESYEESLEGTMGPTAPSYGNEYTDSNGHWEGTWTISDAKWSKKNKATGAVVEEITGAELVQWWKFTVDGDTDTVDIQTLSATLVLDLNEDQETVDRTQARISHSTKHLEFLDNFAVRHISLYWGGGQ